MSTALCPSADALRAFRATGGASPLPGGQGEAWLVGEIILKPGVDDDETRWVTSFYETCKSDRFRLPVPVRASDGRLVVDGWQAWERLAGEHVPGRWGEKLALCETFHANIADWPMPAYMPTRDPNPWVMADRLAFGEPIAVADKVTFDEFDTTFHPRIASVVERLRQCLMPLTEPDQLIHGDFGGNILFADGLAPAIIDMSAYYRPASLAMGVVIADAIVWEGGDMALLDLAERKAWVQGVLRGELRRVIEIERLHAQYGWDCLGQIDAHLALVDELACRYG